MSCPKHLMPASVTLAPAASILFSLPWESLCASLESTCWHAAVPPCSHHPHTLSQEALSILTNLQREGRDKDWFSGELYFVTYWECFQLFPLFVWGTPTLSPTIQLSQKALCCPQRKSQQTSFKEAMEDWHRLSNSKQRNTASIVKVTRG